MSKGARKSAKKGKASQRNSVQRAVNDAASSAQLVKAQKQADASSRLELHATIFLSVILCVLAWAHLLTDVKKRASFLTWVYSVFDFLRQFGVTWRPSHSMWEEMCIRVHSFTSACFFLSGAVDPDPFLSGWEHVRSLWTNMPSTTRYARDPRDLLFALTWGMILFVVRFVFMQCIMLPAGHMLVARPNLSKGGAHYQIQLRRRIARFAEQGWTLVLYSASLVLILAVARRQPWWVWKPAHLWLNYPSTTTDALTKAVYLWEASNYIHQVFVVNLEERRSDYWQMFTHHCVTIVLIGGSYMCCFHYVGIVVILLMDPADICLSTAKLFKYMGFSKFCDVLFAIFMLVWIVTRHILYTFVWWTCFQDAPAFIPFVSTPNLATGHMLTHSTYIFFLALLAALQILLLIWFGMIFKIALRVVTSQGAVDTRSDDDSD